MTLASLALRNVGRNRFRAVLTITAVAVSIVAFLLLRTVVWAWASGADWSAKDRIVTRHKVTFVIWLPKHYIDVVRQAPHIKTATWATWFGAKDPKHEHEFFTSLAVDPETYFEVYNEIDVAPEAFDTWKHDRQGAIVGDVLAKKLGWKVGDRITLQSGIFSGDWAFTVDGIYTARAKSVDRSTLLFSWSYLNDTLRDRQRDMIGWIVSRVDDPARTAEVGVALDKRFEDMDTPTLSQDEGTFQASFLAMFSAVLSALNIISGVILVIMTLIVGNTIAMGVRERTQEFGVLRAIGFMPGHIAAWIVAESMVMALVGGLAGVALALPFINLGVGRFIEENMGSMFPYFRLETGNVVVALVVSALLGIAAAGIPAYRASRIRVVDAVRRVA
ncbi:MAG: FtsX-like permease family protein [Polyangiaceae bacterium]